VKRVYLYDVCHIVRIPNGGRNLRQMGCL